MTTAPLCLYIKGEPISHIRFCFYRRLITIFHVFSFRFPSSASLVIYGISEEFDLNFHALYACVGLWNTFFLIFYSVFDVSRLMKWCTRSTEEIFALFISIAFAADAIKDMIKSAQITHFIILTPQPPPFHPFPPHPQRKIATSCLFFIYLSFLFFSSAESSSISASNPISFIFSNQTDFKNNYYSAQCLNSALNFNNIANQSSSNLTESSLLPAICTRESSLLFLLLMLGTVWVAVSLYNFNKTYVYFFKIA